MSLKRLQLARNLYHSSQIRPSYLLRSCRNYSNALSNASDLFKPNESVQTLTLRSTMVIHFNANVLSTFKLWFFCFWGFGFMIFVFVVNVFIRLRSFPFSWMIERCQLVQWKSDLMPKSALW